MSSDGSAERDAPLERKARRVELRVDIRVRKPGVGKSSGLLLDISNRGCRVELVERVAPADRILIMLPGLDLVAARVAWQRHWIAGLEFENPLHPAVFEMLVTRLKAAIA